jgi:hypothetical protein
VINLGWRDFADMESILIVIIVIELTDIDFKLTQSTSLGNPSNDRWVLPCWANQEAHIRVDYAALKARPDSMSLSAQNNANPTKALNRKFCVAPMLDRRGIYIKQWLISKWYKFGNSAKGGSK